MERKGGSQEPQGICHRLFRFFMNSLAFHKLKHITQRRSGDQYMASLIPTTHENEAYFDADGSFDIAKDLIGVKHNGRFGNVNIIETSSASLVSPIGNEVQKNGSTKRDHTVAIAVGEPNRQSLNGKVHDLNLLSMQNTGVGDKQVKIEDNGAPSSKFSQGRDTKKILNIDGHSLSKRDEQKNSTNLSIDARAEQFIKKQRESILSTPPKGVSSSDPSKNKPRAGAPPMK